MTDAETERLNGIMLLMMTEDIPVRISLKHAWEAGRESTGNPPQVIERKPSEGFRATVVVALDSIAVALFSAVDELNRSRGERASRAQVCVTGALNQIDTLKRGIAL